MEFVREHNFKTQYGESGVLSAKVMWAESIKEEDADDDHEASVRCHRRKCKPSYCWKSEL